MKEKQGRSWFRRSSKQGDELDSSKKRELMMAYYKKHGSMKGLSKRIPQHELRRAMEEEMGVEEESPEETIERLEKDVATLASKCARLEAYTVLSSTTIS